MSADAIVDTSRDIIEQGSKSFSAAAKLFDERTRESAFMLYAWCRYCDDQIDGQDLGFGQKAQTKEAQLERLDMLYDRTRRAMAGESMDEPVFIALQRIVQRHNMPERYPLELLEGFQMDVDDRQYETIEDTLLYCYHVAGVVGVMMAIVMGVDDEATLDRACDLGLGFQLTNICRDIIEDAGEGRMYLPRAWVAEAGIPEDRLSDPAHRTAVFSVAERLLDTAEAYYQSAYYGISRLPLRSGWAIATARGVYRDIGRAVRRKGPQAWDNRVVVSKSRKIMWVLAGGLTAAYTRGALRGRPFPHRNGLWTRP